MKNFILSISFILSSLIGFSQIPAGYYDNAYGLNGDDLRLALFNIIKNHNSVSYSNLWVRFNSTDKKPGTNLIWDMYTDHPNSTNPFDYIYDVDKSTGNHQSEGIGGYNREHAMPKSWFNDAAPLYTDLFHIYPTDGYVNNRRGNFSFGEVGSASYVSNNGSKLGTCNYPGFTSTRSNPKVFEPIDEYKGDFARSYFYMLTRYRFQAFVSNDNGVNNDMVVGSGGTNVAQFTTWAENMLTEWAANDPVSQKEINRNNAVYQIQGNRNPYIDHPEFAAMVFGPLAGIDDNTHVLTKAWYSNEVLTINANIKNPVSLVIYNMLGKKISQQTIQSQENKISVNLPKGIYLVSLDNYVSNTLKFVVQ